MSLGKKLSSWIDTRPDVASFEDQIYDAVVLPGDVCYDIGANRGDMTQRLARLAGRKGLVVAFEPVWPQYRLLCDSLRQLSRHAAPVVPVPCGLADEDRLAEIQVPAGDFGQGSIARAADWQAAHPGIALEAYGCRLVVLDSWMAASRMPPPDFAKIDVEGAELFVLRGASALLAGAAAPMMLIELYAPWQRAFHYGPWDVLSLLATRGYEFLFACPDGLVPHVPSADCPFPQGYEHGYNVLAHVPVRHAGRVAALSAFERGGRARVLPMQPAPRPNVP
jgi:FkbM family methyltransferase